MAQSSIANIAIAADYADAMLTARRAKNYLVAILLLISLLQLGLFFSARYANSFRAAMIAPSAQEQAPSAAAATQPAVVPAATPANTHKTAVVRQLLQYLVGLTGFAGLVAVLVLVGVLAFLVQVMLVGRLIGVSHLTQALIWSMLLAVLLFPWQAFLNPMDFKLPGVLYTWGELVRDSGFTDNPVLKWARFVGWPVVALIITVLIQLKSGRGLGMALGEVPVETIAEQSAHEVPMEPEQ